MIVKTKLYIPQVRNDVVDRSRLMRLLDEGMGAKLTLLSAPAGYGKTTALSEWARQSGKRAAWVSLDKHDDDWIQFWSCVTAAIQEAIPNYGDTVRPFIERGPSASSRSLEPAIGAMLNALDQLEDELAIVIDDYHLIEFPAIHNSISYLLEHLPAHIHLYIASRMELPLPTARLYAEGELKRLTMQDLRFGPEEGLIFFREKTKLPLSREQVVKLCDQTEGWISGMQLAAISLRQSDNIAESVRAFSGHQHPIAEYLLEEVLEQQSDAVRHFLLRTSILRRMNHSLCQAVTGQANAQEQLEELEQAHLFLVPLDADRIWYRYHHLLSDFLQKKWLQSEPDAWMQTHVQAAAWLEAHGDLEEAAEHYLSGRQYEDVVRLMEQHLHPLLFKKSSVLCRWILQVPECFLVNRPYLEWFYLNLMVVDRTRWSEIAAKVAQARTRYEALKGHMEEAAWKKIMGDFYMLSAISSFLQKDLKSAADDLIKAEASMSEDGLTFLIGQNKHFGTEELEDHLFYINDFHEAAAFLHRMTNHCGPRADHPYIASMFASYGKLLYEWNRLEEAEDCVKQMMTPHDKTSIPRMVFHVYLAAARIQLGLGNAARASELMEQLKLKIDSPDYELFMRKIEAEEAWLYVRMGDLAYGERWLARCGMDAADEVTIVHVSEHLALAYVLSACGRTGEAWTLAEKLNQLLVREDRLRDRIKVVILQGLLLYRQGDVMDALYRLDKALGLAQPQGFIRSFIDEGAAMAELLSAYLQEQEHSSKLSEVVRYAERLLRAFPPGVQPSSKDDLTASVCCFGRFQVTAGQSDELKWRTSKTEELMAYLVHHRGQPVGRDHILESLWRDEDAKKAGALFHTTVYYLRKNLSAVGLDGMVQYHRGCYSIDMNRLQCDCDDFQQFMSRDIPTRMAEMKLHEEKLENIYRTGYLDAHDFPWAEQTRSRLASEYIRVLLRMYERYVEKREYTSAADRLQKILEINPFNEDIYAKLIQVLLLAGDRVSAMKQYDSLSEMLRTELGVEPGESIRQLLGVKS